MKSKFIPIIFVFAVFAASSAGGADSPTFPKTGKTYRVSSASVQAPMTGVVKILEHGGGGWFLVEYPARGHGDEPTRFWLNFAHIFSATEVPAQTAETAPKVRIPSSKP